MGIFDTTANTQANAFSDPMNPVNLNRGGWGMDPNYLTPAFSAPYRPPYTGTEGGFGQGNPTLFQAIRGITPFGPDAPHFTGDYQQTNSYFNSIGNKPMDFGAAFAQRVVTPVVAFGGALAIGRAWQVQNTNRMASGAMYNWSKFWGGSNREAFNASRTVSIWTAAGQRVAGGAAQGIASGLGVGGNAGVQFGVRAMGAVGGLAGSLILPALAAEAAMRTADALVYDPYIGVRENQNALRAGFRGVSFAGQDGDPLTGQGLSRRSSARMGTQLGRTGAMDQVFNAREIASMTNMAGQMGMLDGVSSDQITTRMKSLVKQMKVVMSVAETTDFKEAMQLMARLTSAGVNANSASSVMAGISGLASAAGISSNRMMSTVGAQGQYLYQSNGLTPYVGQLAGASAMAGMASAFRSGLVSNELMARLGGPEGAAQLSMTGQVNAAQSTYNQMKAFNRYSLGQGREGVVENVLAYGAEAAKNPLRILGASILDRTMNVSDQIKHDGPVKTTHDQIMDIANMLPGIKRGKNGALDARDAAGIMSGRMGMNEQEIQAYLTQYRSMIDPDARAQFNAGLDSKKMTSTIDYLNRTGQSRYAEMFAPVAKGYREVKAGINDAMGGGIEGVGGLADAGAKWFTEAMYGSTKDLQGERANDRVAGGQTFNSKGLNKYFADTYETDRTTHSVLSKLQSLAKDGDKNALVALSKGASKKEVSNALFALAAGNKIPEHWAKDGATNSRLADVVMSIPKENIDGGSRTVKRGQIEYQVANPLSKSSLDDFTDRIKGGLSDKSIFQDNATILDLTDAYRASNTILAGGLGGVESKDKEIQNAIEVLRKSTALGENASNADIFGMADKVGKMAQQQQLPFSDPLAGLSKDAIRKLASNPRTAGKVFGDNADAYNRYKSATTDQERDEAILRGTAGLNNIETKAPGKYGGGNLDLQERAHQTKQADQLEIPRRLNEQMAREGKISMGEYTMNGASLNMSKAVTEFGRFVTQFGDSVGGKKTQVSPLPNDDRGMLDKLKEGALYKWMTDEKKRTPGGV